MGKPEGIIENFLVNQSAKYGFLCLKFTSPSNSGMPDRIVIGNGRTVFIETKSRTGKTRPKQDFVIKNLKDHGAEVYVVNNKEKIIEILESIKIEER